MAYPFKYPDLYGELPKQGKQKKDLASALDITVAGLRYKQSLRTTGDFSGDEMKKVSTFLHRPIGELFGLDGCGTNT